MMSTAPPLLITCDQASRLQTYIQTYRRYAFASLAPSTGRNATLRILQAMQGKLIDVIDQKTALFMLVLTTEEMMTLKAITAELLLLYGQEPVGIKRNATLGDLAALRANLERSH